MSRPLLITGATGKQGGAVVAALAALPNNDFLILAVTRSTLTSKAQDLLSKYTNTKLVWGNLDDVAKLFTAARAIAGKPIWGVYSMQVSMGTGVTVKREIKQGRDLIDESVRQGVKHFVYSSVERGGDVESWDKPTPMHHFASKYWIEHHLRDTAGAMGWTILRPAAFMDNLDTGFETKVLLTNVHERLGEQKMQWVAVSDIGVFAAKAFAKPVELNHKAVGLAGDELSYTALELAAEDAIGVPIGTTFLFFGNLLLWSVPDFRVMIDWWRTDGCRADIAKLRTLHPELKDMRTWLATESKFPKKGSAGGDRTDEGGHA